MRPEVFRSTIDLMILHPSCRAAVCASALALAGAMVGCGEADDASLETVTVTTQTPSPSPGTTAPDDDTLTTMPSSTVSTTPAETGPETGEGPVDRPPDFPNGGEAFVMSHLSTGIDDSRCTRETGDALTDTAVAGVICELEVTDGVTAYYDLFASTAAMARAYASIRSSQGLTPNSARCVAPRTRGETTWTWDDTGERGRIACFRKNGQSWFVWSQPSTRTIGFARGPRVQDVDAYWRTHGLLRDTSDADRPATGAPAMGG